MHLQGPGGGGTWGIMKKGTKKGTSVSGCWCTDWKECHKSWLPEYLYSLSWIWQDWQAETFSCIMISFLVHRSQHLHRQLFNTSEFNHFFTFEREWPFIYRWRLSWAAGSLIMPAKLQMSILSCSHFIPQSSNFCGHCMFSSKISGMTQMFWTLSPKVRQRTSGTNSSSRKTKSTLHNLCSRALPESKEMNMLKQNQ